MPIPTSTQTTEPAFIPSEILKEIESFEEEAAKVQNAEVSSDVFRPFRLQLQRMLYGLGAGLHQRMRFRRKQSAGVRQPHFPGALGGLFLDVVHRLPHYSARDLQMPLDGAPRAGKMPRL